MRKTLWVEQKEERNCCCVKERNPYSILCSFDLTNNMQTDIIHQLTVNRSNKALILPQSAHPRCSSVCVIVILTGWFPEVRQNNIMMLVIHFRVSHNLLFSNSADSAKTCEGRFMTYNRFSNQLVKDLYLNSRHNDILSFLRLFSGTCLSEPAQGDPPSVISEQSKQDQLYDYKMMLDGDYNTKWKVWEYMSNLYGILQFPWNEENLINYTQTLMIWLPTR